MGAMGTHVTRQVNSEQAARWREELGRMQYIQEYKREIDVWYHALVRAEQQPFLKSSQGGGKVSTNPKMAKLTDLQDKGGWTLVSAWRRIRNLSLAPEVSLHNRYVALGLKKGEGADNNDNGQDPEKDSCKKVDMQTICIRTSATVKAWRVLVIGDSSLTEIEAPICHPDNVSREVCCLPAWSPIHNNAKRLRSLGKLGDHHSFLLFHIGTTEAKTRRLRNIKRDFMSLGKVLKESGTQLVFFSRTQRGGSTHIR